MWVELTKLVDIYVRHSSNSISPGPIWYMHKKGFFVDAYYWKFGNILGTAKFNIKKHKTQILKNMKWLSRSVAESYFVIGKHVCFITVTSGLWSMNRFNLEKLVNTKYAEGKAITSHHILIAAPIVQPPIIQNIDDMYIRILRGSLVQSYS